MQLTKDSLIKIKSYITSTEKLDLSIYETIIEILRNDPLFDNPIKYEKVKDEDIHAGINKTTGELYYSDSVIPYSENFYPHLSFLPGYNDIDAFNYKLLFTLLHELGHLKQYDYSKNDDGIIGEIYRNTFESEKINDDYYKKNPYDYVFEYNADMEAMRVMNTLYSDNMFLKALNLIEYLGLLNNVYYDFDKNMFIAEKTYDLLELDSASVKQIHDLPVDVLVHNGLPVRNKVLNKLYGNPFSSVKYRKKYNL